MQIKHLMNGWLRQKELFWFQDGEISAMAYKKISQEEQLPLGK